MAFWSVLRDRDSLPCGLRKGHRIRVTVTSGAENFIFPNSNTREGYNSAVTVVAENPLPHGGAHASKLIVRVEE